MRCPNCGYQTNGGDQLSTGGWFVRILLSFIPVVGFIALLVWALGSPRCRSLKNMGKGAAAILHNPYDRGDHSCGDGYCVAPHFV